MRTDLRQDWVEMKFQEHELIRHHRDPLITQFSTGSLKMRLQQHTATTISENEMYATKITEQICCVSLGNIVPDLHN